MRSSGDPSTSAGRTDQPDVGDRRIRGLQHDGQLRSWRSATGFSFTVPAGTTQRTLTVWTSAHCATGRSPPPLRRKRSGLHAGRSRLAGLPELRVTTAPACSRSITRAVSPGQHLTVNLIETANNCCGRLRRRRDLRRGALRHGGASARSVSATFSSDASVGDVRIGPDPESRSARSTRSPTARRRSRSTASNSPTRSWRTPSWRTPSWRTRSWPTPSWRTRSWPTPSSRTPSSRTRSWRIPSWRNTQLANTQLAHTQLAHTQLAHTQLAHTGLPLDTVPLNPTLYPGGWAGLLQGTTLAGQPLQTITLADVLASDARRRSAPAAASSPLRT